MKQDLLPTKQSKGTHNHAEIIGGTSVEVSVKNKPNGTVNPIGTVQVFAGSGDISKDLSWNGQYGNGPMEGIGDTSESHSQATQGKVIEFNGTVVPELEDTD